MTSEMTLRVMAFECQVNAQSNRGTHVLARFDPELGQPASWSASGLYQAIKAFLTEAAKGFGASDAVQLKRASTHWLWHSWLARAARQGRAAPCTDPGCAEQPWTRVCRDDVDVPDN